ncbi:MAG TPA: RNA 2',3'-cyclic phosphodiesterase [Thermoanaerobaculia bacterium]|jgi:2'-5' RNA ligase|nr:RNA 2',3'-cyclic phosphodiesterase [Thermoanaerobaculia bacterium]
MTSASNPPTTYRLFVAIEIPEAVQSEVGRRIEPLRESLSADGKTRWVDPRGLHLTVLFLGDIAADLVPWLGEELAAACAPRTPFELALHGAGTFPPARPARVAWVGMTAPPELHVLVSALSAAAGEAIGHPAEERPFVPHLTVARCREPWQRPAIATFTSAFSGPIGEPFAVSEAVLVRSHLGETVRRSDGTEGRGSRHEVLRRMPLGVAPPAAEEADEAPSEEEAV